VSLDQAQAWSLSTDFPIALLPIRLETRLAQVTANSKRLRLCLRVYPDQVHIDEHEPTLSDTELHWGTDYWSAILASKADDGRRTAAWKEMADRFSPERASWIARVTQPVVLPDAQLHWPHVLPRSEAWGRQPLAQLLPTEWHVSGTAKGDGPDGGTHSYPFGASIQALPDARPLPAGFDPAGTANVSSDGLTIPSGMGWMIDFKEGINKGMALEIDLPEETSTLTNLTIERLIVFGVDTQLQPQAGAEALAGLLEAHYHTDGFDFVPPGTPTNTTDTVLSGYNPRSAAQMESLAVGKDDHAPTDEDANATLLSVAFGLPAQSTVLTDTRGGLAAPGPSAFARTSYAADRDDALARHMNVLLWPVTWGYFIWHMMGPTFNNAQIDWGRRHFVEFVRAAGPLPAVRIGTQPYGILPVTSLAQWDDSANDATDNAVTSLLRALLAQIWLPATDEVPRLEPGSPPSRLYEVLGVSAQSVEYAARGLLGREYLEYLLRFPDETFHVEEADMDSPAGILRALGLAWDPRIAHMAFLSDAEPITSLLGDNEGPATEPLASFAAWLRTRLPGGGGGGSRPWEELRDQTNLPDQPKQPRLPLLHRLLRHSALVQLTMAAFRRPEARLIPFAQRERYNFPGEEHERELINIRLDDPGKKGEYTIWWLLGQPADGGGTVGDALYKSPPSKLPPELVEFCSSLEALASLPAPTLQRLAAQTLDLASHRIDAWVTSFASKRLRALPSRAKNATNGVHVGAFGWVERLRPAASAEEKRNYGYLHAPSDSHALTAAVLKAAHLATTESDPPVAIDLPSARVRQAMWLLDGIRQQQPFGALLGYRFERRLQESPERLGGLIKTFRDAVPLEGIVVTPEGSTEPAPLSSKVTDGLSLHRQWCTICGTRTLNLDKLGIEDAPSKAAVRNALDELHDLIDAVADALLTESVHHVVAGRPEPAGAVTAVLNAQGRPPDDFDVFRTPRTGVSVTHRILLATDRRWPADPELWPKHDGRPAWPDHWPLTAPNPGKPAPWQNWPAFDKYQARAFAEPTLNALAGDLLPRPGLVFCQLKWDPPVGNRPASIPLNSLSLSPLDYVYLARRQQSGPAASTEIGKRILARLAALFPDRPKLDFGRDAAWSTDRLSVAEFLEAARAVADLLLSGRPLQPNDLAPTGATPAVVPSRDLADRANAALARLDAAINSLSAPESFWEGLLIASGLGVGDSYPEPGSDDVALEASAQRVRAELIARRNRLPSDDADRLGCVFGADESGQGRFPVLPVFVPENRLHLGQLSANSTELQGKDELEVLRWLHRTARVCPGARRLLDAALYREALTGDAPQLAVLQLEGPEGRWLALDLPEDPKNQPRRIGGLSVVLQTPPGVSAQGLFAADNVGGIEVARSVGGVSVDGWTEVIPNKEETTAIALRADTPAACAPQAILLAVAPRAGTAWTPALLEQTVEEAIDLVHCRGVHPDMFDIKDGASDQQDVAPPIGQYLPAICCAFNAQGHTVSTTFLDSGNA
jgi:hypothetical protein